MNQNDLLITRLLTNIFGTNNVVKKFLHDINSLINNNGVQYTVRYMKAVKLHITRYMCGHPLMVNKALVSVDTEGFPTKFHYLKELINGSTDQKRLVLSLLSYNRAIKPKSNKDLPKPDYTTITNPYKGKEYTIPHWFIKDFVKKYKLKLPRPQWDNSLHYISNKSSPFGQATLSGMFGLFYFIHHAPHILGYFLEMLGETLYKNLLEGTIRLVYTDHRSFTASNRMAEGKLSIVKDPELKMRVIAMVDYYSQWLLKPIHLDILNKLRNFKCDRTFTQDPFHNWGKTMGNNFWSLDLSAATDRFPISLQEKLMGHIYDPQLASAWRKILVERDYMTPEGNQLRYAVGQPMGAYSSWAVFTISHHLVVQWCSYLCKQDDFDKYILLGDDIVINNDKVANKYITIMTRLGVDISVAKTHVSKNTYEFAKRWIKSKKEITGLPLRGILNNTKSIQTIIINVVSYLYRLNPISPYSTREILARSLKGLKINKRYLSFGYLYPLIDSSLLMIRYHLKLITYEEIRNYFNMYLKRDDILIPKEDEIYLFLNRVLSIGLQSFAEKSGNSLKHYFDRFVESTYPLISTESIKHSPIVHGLYQKLLKVKNAIMRSNNIVDFDIIDIIDDIRIDEPDKLVEKVRNSSKPLVYLDQLWRKSMKSLEHVNDFHHQYDTLKPMENFINQNLSNELDKLDLLRYGINNSVDKGTAPILFI
uniref:RNA-dependent RNA polymerase n=1 Tax=Plasmopara viticola lesion associated mitovirus 10 TaxID=2719435 RepID=A0A6G9RTA3_9VIRU|nr:RNA-dependent RNA polymerase [Plasmopara viticola lesion associated mitovirus 10]